MWLVFTLSGYKHSLLPGRNSLCDTVTPSFLPPYFLPPSSSSLPPHLLSSGEQDPPPGPTQGRHSIPPHPSPTYLGRERGREGVDSKPLVEQLVPGLSLPLLVLIEVESPALALGLPPAGEAAAADQSHHQGGDGGGHCCCGGNLVMVNWWLWW